MKINSRQHTALHWGVLISIVIAALIIHPTWATTTTYTETFDSQTAFDSTESDAFTYWADGAGMMVDTAQSIPSPFFYPTNASFFNIARSGQYLFGAYSP